MSDPRRLLLDPRLSGPEQQLLRSWSDEQPSNEARERAMALAAVAKVAAASTIAAGAGAKVATTSVAPKAAATFGALSVKWIAFGIVVVGALGAGGAVYLGRHRQDSAKAPAPPPPPATLAPTNAAPPVVAPSPSPSPSASEALAEDVAPAPRPASPVAAAQPHAQGEHASTLNDQIAELDRIRAAVREGDTPRALRLVDEYERKRPGGAFVEEAEVLRIEALARHGDQAAARRAADRFLAAHPSSPHAARVRALVGASP